MFIDAHAHIDRLFFKEGLDGVIDRFRAAGVHGVVTVGSGGIDAMQAAIDVARRNRDIVAAIGCHPHEADRFDDALADAMILMAADSSVGAIGETGLDFHYNLSSRDAQIRAFTTQLEIAARLDLPVVIHSREATELCLDIVRDAGRGRVRGQIHCFTGNVDDARGWLDLGFMVSIPGVVTFRNVPDLLEAVSYVPDDALLIETDSPYLAPVPMRGRTNEPAFIQHTAAAVAAARNQSVEHVAAVTSRNAELLFKL